MQKAVAARVQAAQKKKRKKKSRQQALIEAATAGDGDLPDAPVIPAKPSVGAMPQQVFVMSGRIPPDFTSEDADLDVIDAESPTSDIRSGAITMKPQRTNDFTEANVFAYVPKVFQFSSVLLHAAWQVTVNEWGWDPQMPMGKWLDAYLFMTMERLGVKLMAYQISGPGGNGHDHEQERIPSAHAPDGAAPGF